MGSSVLKVETFCEDLDELLLHEYDSDESEKVRNNRLFHQEKKRRRKNDSFSVGETNSFLQGQKDECDYDSNEEEWDYGEDEAEEEEDNSEDDLINEGGGGDLLRCGEYGSDDELIDIRGLPCSIQRNGPPSFSSSNQRNSSQQWREAIEADVLSDCSDDEEYDEDDDVACDKSAYSDDEGEEDAQWW